MVLRGRLGLERARVPHADRHGLLYLDRGQVSVRDGCLRFVTGPAAHVVQDETDPALAPGDYQIPHQGLSCIQLGPGGSVTHDALRLMARHGTTLVAVGTDGVRCYTAPPLGPDRSDLARRQARLWADEETRLQTARQLYAWRLGEVLPRASLDVLRGIEGARMRESYKLVADQFGIDWKGRRYDRQAPDATDLPNQAINHAATAVQAAAATAVAALSALPPLGFIHEDSDQSFVLDIADLYRVEVTLPVAFAAAKTAQTGHQSVDRLVRKGASKAFSEKQLISTMIDRIKRLFGEVTG